MRCVERRSCTVRLDRPELAELIGRRVVSLKEILAAVDDHRLAGDEVGGRRAEEDDRAHDVLRHLVALDRSGGDRHALGRGRRIRMSTAQLPPSNAMMSTTIPVTIIVVVTALFLVSATSGVEKGINFLANLGMIATIGLFGFVMDRALLLTEKRLTSWQEVRS